MNDRREINAGALLRKNAFEQMKAIGKKAGKYVTEEQYAQALNDLDAAIERTKQESFAYCRYRDQYNAELERRQQLFGDDPDLALDEEFKQRDLMENATSKNSPEQQINNKVNYKF